MTTDSRTRTLIPVDFSEASDAAVEYAKRFVPDSEVRFLHVLDTVESFGNVVAMAGDIAKRESAAASKLSALTQHFAGSSHAVCVGKAAEEIIRAAQGWKADLIIISRHSDRKVRHLVLGSVAAEVVRSSDCPVLVVPPAAAGPL